MRKAVCTGSVFIAIVVFLVLSFVIQVPETVWWNSDKYLNMGTPMPIMVWALFNVGGPIYFAACFWLVSVALWKLSEYICGKLRSDRANN